MAYFGSLLQQVVHIDELSACSHTGWAHHSKALPEIGTASTMRNMQDLGYRKARSVCLKSGRGRTDTEASSCGSASGFGIEEEAG